MKRGFTLPETMTAIAMSAMLLAPVGKLFVDGTRQVMRSTRMAGQVHTSAILAERWRLTLRDTRPESWRIEERAFVFDGGRIEVSDRRLLFQRGDSCVPVAFPAGTDPAFEIERSEDLAPCAVLRLHWSKSVLSDGSVAVRVAACGRGPLGVDERGR